MTSSVFEEVSVSELGAETIASSTPQSQERLQTEELLGLTHAQALERVTVAFGKAKKIRLAREITWWLCCAFYLDDHYADINKDGTAVITGIENAKRVPKWRVRHTNNKIAPAADEQVGRMVRAMTSLTASAKTTDPEDLDKALMATSVLEAEWRRMDLTLEDHELRLWTVLCGTGGIWTRWNDTLGELIQFEDGHVGPTGEIETLVVDPFNMYPDPDGARFRNMGWFMHAEEISVDLLKSAYPDLADDIGPDNLRRGNGTYWEDRIRSLMSSALGVRYEVSYGENATTLMTYWAPRTREFPNGLMIISTPSVVLWMGENPWAHFAGGGRGWCPIEIFRYRSLSKAFWGMGAVQSAIPTQRQLNRTLSQILEQRNEVCNPKYWVPFGCKVSNSQWLNQPGERIVYKAPPPEMTGGGKAYRPEREDPPNIPGSLFKLVSDFTADIEDIFAYHQVSKGGAPPGVRSGVAIENLQEQDQAPTIPIVLRHNICWSRVGKRMLQLVYDHWEVERIIDVRGDDGYEEVRSFKGSDIPPYLSVTVDSDIMLPQTRVGKLNTLLAFVKHSILTPIEAREAIFGGENTIRAAVHRASLDQKKQARENRRMASGTFVQVDHFDDHMVHLKTLNDFRKTASFERIKDQKVPFVGPQGQPFEVTIAEITELHAQGHGEALMQIGPMAMMGATGSEALPTEGAEGGQPASTGASSSDGVDASTPDSGGI